MSAIQRLMLNTTFKIYERDVWLVAMKNKRLLNQDSYNKRTEYDRLRNWIAEQIPPNRMNIGHVRKVISLLFLNKNLVLFLWVIQRKAKIIRVPFEINLSNGVNDHFAIHFSPKTATPCMVSYEFTKYIDDDCSKLVKACVINQNAAADFSFQNRSRKLTE